MLQTELNHLKEVVTSKNIPDKCYTESLMASQAIENFLLVVCSVATKICVGQTLMVDMV